MPTARRPASASSKIKRPRASASATVPAGPACYGLADFRQKGSQLIADVCMTGNQVYFSTSSVPQIRMRSAAKHRDEVAEIDEDARFTFAASKAHFLQIRAAIMFGEPFLISAKKNAVILDRHPDYPHEIMDGVRRRWESAARATAHAITRKHAKLASQTSRKIEEMLKPFLAEQERVAGKLVEDLAAIRLRAVLTPEDKGKLAEIERKVGVLWFREGARKDGDGRRSLDQHDLERY
jgi:hypothetical protein